MRVYSWYRTIWPRMAVSMASVVLAGVVSACSTAKTETTAEPSGNPLIKTHPKVHLEGTDLALLSWDRADDGSLWEVGTVNVPHLEAWQGAITAIVGATEPVALIRRNRELFPWLEREFEGVRRINQRVESGELGALRKLNRMESFLLDFHASRYPLVERPSEFAAFLLSRSNIEDSRLRIYYLTDGEGLPPKDGSETLIGLVESDRRAGWNVRVLVHNHTFDFASEKGMLAIAAPSESDLQLFSNLAERLGLDQAWVLDGFNSIELSPDEFGNQEKS